MDKSRPGHPARLPLIIERPDLAHPARRAVGLALTLFAWGVWLTMWFVVVTTIGRALGFDLPHLPLPSTVSLDSFVDLALLVPFALAAALTILAFAYAYERFKRRWAKPDERWRPVGMERLARDAALDPEKIEDWQQAQILYVEHGPRGRVTNAYTSRPD